MYAVSDPRVGYAHSTCFSRSAVTPVRMARVNRLIVSSACDPNRCAPTILPLGWSTSTLNAENASPSRREEYQVDVSSRWATNERPLALQHFSQLASDCQIRQHRHVRRVPVMHIMRCELVMPPQLARIRVEREERAGIEVVARPIVAVVVGVWVARAHVHQIERWIIAARHPS